MYGARLCAPVHEAVVLTHTGATAAEMEPYLASRLRPLTPVVLYGREAQAELVRHPMECVYYGWRDGFEFSALSCHSPCVPSCSPHALLRSAP